ncbi:hypothetical protein IPJ72_05615 [Candidatus Peregrinibacteria bacterium]|nr:MAG: hypothetical protein IPJ72_05615 [Candidatus Peregrinibacteria bacterium]
MIKGSGGLGQWLEELAALNPVQRDEYERYQQQGKVRYFLSEDGDKYAVLLIQEPGMEETTDLRVYKVIDESEISTAFVRLTGSEQRELRRPTPRASDGLYDLDEGPTEQRPIPVQVHRTRGKLKKLILAGLAAIGLSAAGYGVGKWTKPEKPTPGLVDIPDASAPDAVSGEPGVVDLPED